MYQDFEKKRETFENFNLHWKYFQVSLNYFHMNYSLKYDSNLVAVEVIPFYWSIYLFMSHTYHSYGVSHTLWLMENFLFWPNPFLFVQVRTAVTKDNDNSPFKIIFRWLTILRNTFGVAFRTVINQKLRPEFERFSKNGRKLGKKEPFFKFLFLFITTRGLREHIFGIFWKKKFLASVGIELVAGSNERN